MTAHTQNLNSNNDTAGTKTEIINTLNLWNNAAKERNLDKFMNLYDGSDDILMVGSDSGEIFKGKAQIRDLIKMLFDFASFSWEFDRLDIDNYENTAWVFADGRMVITPVGKETHKAPYRFTGVLIKVNNEWKWRLFNGSVPNKE